MKVRKIHNNRFAYVGNHYNWKVRSLARTLRDEIRKEIDNAILDELFKSFVTGVERL